MSAEEFTKLIYRLIRADIKMYNAGYLMRPISHVMMEVDMSTVRVWFNQLFDGPENELGVAIQQFEFAATARGGWSDVYYSRGSQYLRIMLDLQQKLSVLLGHRREKIWAELRVLPQPIAEELIEHI